MPSKKPQPKVIKQNVGVDVSKDDFKVYFYHLDQNSRKFIKGNRTFKNTLAGFMAFMKWIEKKRISDLEVRITLEATGVYHENLTHFLDDNGYYVSVILANQSKAYRVTLLNERTALTNRLHALDTSFEPHKKVIKRLKQRVKLLNKQLKEVEKEIEQTIQTDEVLKQKVDNICKVKGLGITTVATIIAETNGFVLFTSRGQLISYAGYDVVQRESGTSVKGPTRISKKGNSHIRRALHFPALVVVKHEPHFKQIFERVVDRSGIKMKGYVAVQRKILILIYTLFKNNVPYDPDYQKTKEESEKVGSQNCRQDTNPAYAGCLL